MGDTCVWIAEKETDVDFLYNYEDDVTKYIEGSREAWIGWLRVQVANNPMMALIYIELGGEIKGYCVATKTIMPPVTSSIFILYAHSTLGPEDGKKVWAEICEWARGIGAKGIDIKTDHPEFFLRHYGFEKDKFTSLSMRL